MAFFCGKTVAGTRVNLACFALLLCSVAACSAGEAPAAAAPPTERPTVADRAVEDLSRRLDLATDEIRLVREDPVTWRDGSLGCPREGMMYTQALVPGVRIVLEAAGQQFEYHAAKGTEPFLCENPRPPAGVSSNE